MPITCQICGKEFPNIISSTHLKQHNMKSSEYKLIYGEHSLASPEYRKRRSEQNSGKNNPNYGNTWSAAQRQNLSEQKKGKEPWNKGKTITDERVLNNVRKGIEQRELKYKTGELTRSTVSHTPESRKHLSDKIKAYAESNPELMKQRAKKSHDTRIRNGNNVSPMKGKHHTPDARRKISESSTRLAKEKSERAYDTLVSVIDKLGFDLLNFDGWVVQVGCRKCNTVFEYTRQYYTDSKRHGAMCPGCYPRAQSVSESERHLREFINDIGIEYLCNVRSVIAPQELDIYIPDKKIAIEFNGSYWHSENNGKDKNYHNSKTKACADKGIQLIHIWEHDWNTKQELIKSRIKAKLGINKRIYARTTTILEVGNVTATKFLNENHIQGSCPASLKYGLFHGTELVALMTFGKSRYKKDIDWELIRYCSKQGINVVGGASRLLKRFMETNAGGVISYSDRMWNNGGLYNAIGFEYSHTSEPAYYYTRDYVSFENRVKYQKHKLPKLLESFNADKTEWENMQANRYDRIWDCGNDVWILRR